eukprot:XP_001701408.1 predicted protein [Chlamydomonas reinhardtii]
MGASATEVVSSLDPEQRFYTVCIKSGTCTCGDCVTRNVPCKHMFMVLEAEAEPALTFADLPASFIRQPNLEVYAHVTGGALPTLQQIPEEKQAAEVEALAQLRAEELVLAQAEQQHGGSGGDDGDEDGGAHATNRA